LIGGPLLSGGTTAEIEWPLYLLIAIALILDAVDGYLARRNGEVSKFGARFDIEIDALLLLFLAVLVWQTGKVEVWALAIGLIRYVFVAAGWCLTCLAVSLKRSWRRQFVGVLQSLALLACLSPMVDSIWAPTILTVALGTLLISFGIDVFTLMHSSDLASEIDVNSDT
jgi:phosphatidylglycerophosphate synthase